MESGKRKVILLTTNAWSEYFATFFCHHKFDKIILTSIETEESWRKSLKDVEENVDTALSESKGAVPIIIASMDSHMSAHGHIVEYLKEKGMRMTGASMLGFSICTYKILTRKLVDGLQSIKAIPVYSHEEFIEDKGQTINGKVVVKPVSESGGIDVHVLDLSKGKVKNPFFGYRQDTRDFDNIPSVLKFMKKDEIKDLVGVCEGYVDHSTVYWTPCVDGYIQNGKIQEIVLTDSFYKKDDAQKYDFCYCPSVLPQKEQQLCFDLFKRVCSCLYEKYGVDNQLVCVEMFMTKEENEPKLHVIEINLRNSMNNMATFLSAYESPSGDMVELMKRLQVGKEIPPPKLTGKTGVCLYRKPIANSPMIMKEGKYTYFNSKNVFGDCCCHVFFDVDSIGDLEKIRNEVSSADEWIESLKKKF